MADSFVPVSDDQQQPGVDEDPTPDQPVVDEPVVDEASADRPSVVDEDPTADQPDRPDQPDLDAITADLDAVDVALARLADGTYWVDEVTGERITDEALVADPLRRRA